ncbi:MAG: tetratricopeptide repeat protein [Elusimicrobiaceae bacterium]|nr:tetratricopeptide repeat protein [Elusimicrobiaceae bacterium]
MKLFFIFSFIFFFTNIFAQDTQKCLNKSKEFFEQKEYSYAQKTLESCLKNDPKNVDVLVSLGGVCMKQNNYNEAIKYFKESLKNMAKTSPYVSYVYARIGDSYSHLQDFTRAANYYEASLNYEPANINSLVGKGICEEKKGNIQKAAEYFKKALAVDFTNLIARERLIALEPQVLSYEELISTMKERNILDPNAVTYQPQDLDLLTKMINAEKDNAITYLSSKYNNRIPPGLIIEKFPGKIYSRKILTYSGYKDLMFLLSKEAIDFFIKNKVYKSEILKLRDLNGNNIFTDKGLLTEEGLVAYTQSLSGKKAYLLPSEPIPSAAKKAEMKVQELLKQGYMEITILEYAYIMEKSRCNEQTLIKTGVKIIQGAPNRNRFLIIDQIKKPSKFDCPADTQVCYYNMVMEKRKQKKDRDNTPVYTSTFGTGAKASPHICKENGTLESLGI